MILTSDVRMWVVTLFFSHGKYNIIIRTIGENNLEYKYERLLFLLYLLSVCFALSLSLLLDFFLLRKKIKLYYELNSVTEE
jgi:hypothetical protein